MTNQHVFNLVFNALARREGKKTTLPTLVSLTGLTERQVQNTIANARRVNATYAAQIEVIKPGHEWRFQAAAADGNNYPSVENVVKAVEVGSTHIWKRVLKALTDRQGQIVSKDELAFAASTPESEITPQQAANAMMTILRQPLIGQQIQTIKSGANWRYAGQDKIDESNPSKKSVVSSSIRGSVLRYALSQPDGTMLLVDTIAKDLGFGVKQVQNAMYDIVTGNSDFTIIQRGHTWQYTPRVATTPKVKEQTSNGRATLDAVPARGQTLVAVTDKPAPQPTSKPAPSGRLFEEVATLDAGKGELLLKEADSGAFFRATPLT